MAEHVIKLPDVGEGVAEVALRLRRLAFGDGFASSNRRIGDRAQRRHHFGRAAGDVGGVGAVERRRDR